MRGGCLLAVGARRARGSNKFSSVQFQGPILAVGARRARGSNKFSSVPRFNTVIVLAYLNLLPQAKKLPRGA